MQSQLKERAYEVTYGDKNDRWIIPKDKLSQEALAYIDRLKEACNSAVRSFTRMETLYRLKCNELEMEKQQAVREFVEELRKRIDKIRHPNEYVINIAFCFVKRTRAWVVALKQNQSITYHLRTSATKINLSIAR